MCTSSFRPPFPKVQTFKLDSLVSSTVLNGSVFNLPPHKSFRLLGATLALFISEDGSKFRFPNSWTRSLNIGQISREKPALA